jgi:hypothetical protein
MVEEQGVALRLVVPYNQRCDKWNFFQWKRFYMKRSKFSDSRILDAVKRFEAGLGVPDICRELGISTAIFYK